MQKIRKYKLLSGEFAGQIFDGFPIGIQDYPDQIKKENFTSAQIDAKRQERYAKGEWEGIWIIALNKAVYKPNPIQGVRSPLVEITSVVNYDNVYADMVTPMDRFNNEIFIGDYLYVSVKNETRLVKVIKFAEKPYHYGYGIMQRKMTVIDEFDDNRKFTINDSYATIKK